MTRPPFIVVVPARLRSTRLPDKPLRLLGGRPLIQHALAAALATGAAEVVLATDAPEVAEAIVASALPIRICMTASTHASGTDRLAECAELLAWEDDTVVVNLQGDEPFMPAACVHAVVDALAASDAPMATLAMQIHDPAEVFDANVVKVACRADGRALYFSRAPLPWARTRFAEDRVSPLADAWLRHVGLYAYRAGFLRRFAAMSPGRLERIEMLEQLRVLEAGAEIAVAFAPEPVPPGIDTLADLQVAEALLAVRAQP